MWSVGRRHGKVLQIEMLNYNILLAQQEWKIKIPVVTDEMIYNAPDVKLICFACATKNLD